MGKMNRDDFLKSVEHVTPRTHDLEQAIFDGKVSDDNREYSVDKVAFVGDDGVVRSIKTTSHKRCDFGHLEQSNVNFLSQCSKCGKVTYTTEGCGYTCVRCGYAFCRRHVSVYSDGQAYCSRCRWYKYLTILLDLLRKVVT